LEENNSPATPGAAFQLQQTKSLARITTASEYTADVGGFFFPPGNTWSCFPAAAGWILRG